MHRLGLAADRRGGFRLVHDASATDRIRLAVQRTGTLAWELDIIKAHGLDRKSNLDIAADRAGFDRSRQDRAQGRLGRSDAVRLAVGRARALARRQARVLSVVLDARRRDGAGAIADQGHRRPQGQEARDRRRSARQELAAAAGARAALRPRPAAQATLVYGAPPLLPQKALQGEHDATLTFWNFCADLESKGFTRAIAVDDVMRQLGAKAPVAIVGYTFDGGWAHAQQRRRSTAFSQATRQAKEILAASEAEWQRLAPRIGVSDPKALAIYRQRYGEGIWRRPVADEVADARALYRVLAEVGGSATGRAAARARRGHVLPAPGEMSRGGEDRLARAVDCGLVRGLAACGAADAAGPAGGRAHDGRRGALGRARVQSRRDAGAGRGRVRACDGARLGDRPCHGPLPRSPTGSATPGWWCCSTCRRW